MDERSIEHWMEQLDYRRDDLLLATGYIDGAVKRDKIQEAIKNLEIVLQKLKEEVNR